MPAAGAISPSRRTRTLAFLALIGKVLPTTLANDPSDPLVVEILHITVDGKKP